MIGFVFPIYNSSKTIHYPFDKFHIVLKRIQDTFQVNPYILIIDDCSSEEETTKCQSFIMSKLHNYHDNILFLKNVKNLGVFATLNKAMKIIMGEYKIVPSDEIKYVIKRDSDDYITTGTIHLLKELINNNYLGIPTVKLDLLGHEIDRYFKMIKKVDSWEKLEEKENQYRFLYESATNRMFFGNDEEFKVQNPNKALCLKEIPDSYTEFYDLFNVYAMSAYNVDLFRLIGGYDLYTTDSAGTKGKDINKLRVLNYVLKNVVRKTEEHFIDKLDSPKIKQLKEIINKTNFSNLYKYPSIFRYSREASLSSGKLEDREYFHFVELKKLYDVSTDVYGDIRNIKNSFMFLKQELAIDLIVDFCIKLANNIIQELYTPFVTYEGEKIIHKGNFWKFN